MKKLILIKMTAISAAISVMLGVASCDMGTSEETIPGETAAQTTAVSADPSQDTKPAESSASSSADDGSGNAAGINYLAAKTITKATTEKKMTYQTKSADESALIVNGIDKEKMTVAINNATVKKTGNTESGDFCNRYGVNAAFLALGGARVTIKGGTFSSEAKGSTAVYSYGGYGKQNGMSGDGTTVTISDATVTTGGENSGGITTSVGGNTTISNVTVRTKGNNSPAINSSKGGGVIKITKGSYTTEGADSPAIYSTATMTIKSASFTANRSEAVVGEGETSMNISDSDIISNHVQRREKAQFFSGVLLYTPDPDTGYDSTSEFTMARGKITNKRGHVFHVTNTKGVISLSGVSITNEDKDNVLLSVSPDGWGGGNNVAILNLAKCTINSDILVAKKAKLTLNLSGGASFTGKISGKITDADGQTVSTERGVVHVNIDSTSTWTLTEDTYVTSFTGNMKNVNLNGYQLHINEEAPEATPTPKPTKKPTKKATKKKKKTTKKPTKKPTKKATKKKKATPTPKP